MHDFQVCQRVPMAPLKQMRNAGFGKLSPGNAEVKTEGRKLTRIAHPGGTKTPPAAFK
jgi:hypothetical protein